MVHFKQERVQIMKVVHLLDNGNMYMVLASNPKIHTVMDKWTTTFEENFHFTTEHGQTLETTEVS